MRAASADPDPWRIAAQVMQNGSPGNRKLRRLLARQFGDKFGGRFRGPNSRLAAWRAVATLVRKRAEMPGFCRGAPALGA